MDRRGRETLELAGDEVSISELGDYVVRLEGPSADQLCFAAPIEALPTVGSGGLLGLLGRPPGLGVVRLEIIGADGTLVWRRSLFVRPEKLRDRTEFESMVTDLCNWRTAIALDLHAHSSAPWVWSDAARTLTPEERLVVLRAAVEDNQLFGSLKKVERSALVRLNRDFELVSLGREEVDPSRLGRHVNGPGARVSLPMSHPLAASIASLPALLPPARKIETVDTPENQFVKVVIRRFREAISEALRELPYYSGSAIMTWAREAERRLRSVSASTFFSKVSWPAQVSLGSPALQRRDGYKNVLLSFLDLRAGFSMPWAEMRSAVYGETRDVPTIYEYWCLLQLRDKLEEEFGTVLDLDHFLISSGQLKVRRGAASRSRDPIEIAGQHYALTLHYNRTFSPTEIGMDGRFHAHGSAIGTWSKPMKPDFTIAIHPGGLSESQASEQGLLQFVHLDAKYRLRRLVGNAEATHIPDDLDKMHSYASSINHSWGAFALFPGDTEELFIAPSSIGAVGAIPVAPTRTTGFGATLRLILEKAAASCGEG
ncbi:DUF2357 domain-containing protein [Methylobacterium brachiatum]|uniref:DUF2357 domain-containing protein n=1 Tax=Methylobacterium brachiatum TaxID=269660 RepID=UPI003315C9A6